MNLKLTLLFFLLVAYVSSGAAQESDTSATVENVVEKLYNAMVEKEESVLERLTAEKLTYGHSSGTLEDKAQFIEAVMNGPFDYLSISPENQQITISGDVALVRHIFVTKALNDGEPTTVRIGNLMTYQKQDGEWKLLGRQAYKL